MDEIAERYAEFERTQIESGRVCGSCELFLDEDMSGNGTCAFSDGQTHCSETCRHWTARLSDYQALVKIGHSGAKALEVILDAKRGDQHAIRWIAQIRSVGGSQ